MVMAYLGLAAADAGEVVFYTSCAYFTQEVEPQLGPNQLPHCGWLMPQKCF